MTYLTLAALAFGISVTVATRFCVASWQLKPAFRNMCVGDSGPRNVTAPLTPVEAQRLAAEFLKEKKMDWGEPIRVSGNSDQGFDIRYKTEPSEEKKVGPRTIFVSPEGKVSIRPRR